MYRIMYQSPMHKFTFSNMPNGRIVLFPTITLTFAFTFSMITLMIPRFVVPSGYQGSYYGAGFWPYSASGPSILSSGQAEVVSYEYSNYFSYEQHETDAYRKTAMSLGLVASIFGMGTMIGLWPITCQAYNKTARRTVFLLTFVTFLSQVCTFFMFATEYCDIYTCKVGPGGCISIVASILWLIGLVGVANIPGAKSKEQQANSNAAIEVAVVAEDGRAATTCSTRTVTTTEKNCVDGSKVIETVTTHPDGSKTVERTIETPSVVAHTIEK